MTGAVIRLLENRKSLEKSLEQTKAQFLSYEAKELIEHCTGKVVSQGFQNRSIQELQKLAKLLVLESENKIFLLVAENEDKLQFVFARGKDAEGNMKALAGEALALINGKGGGNESFAQGGGELKIPGEQLLKITAEKLN